MVFGIGETLERRRWMPHRPRVLMGDSGYAVLDLLHCCQSLAQLVTIIARLRLDAALYAATPPRLTGQNVRPLLKGRRRPALKALLDLPTVSCVEVSAAWYNGTTRMVELRSQTALWYRSSKPPVHMRWVLIRDPQGAFTSQALALYRFGGGLDADPAMVCAALATGQSPFGRYRPIWAWKPSVSGRTWPSPAQRPFRWGYSPGPSGCLPSFR